MFPAILTLTTTTEFVVALNNCSAGRVNCVPSRRRHVCPLRVHLSALISRLTELPPLHLSDQLPTRSASPHFTTTSVHRATMFDF